MRFTVEQLIEGLPLPPNEKWKDGVWDVEPHESNGVTLVFFAPRGTDHQTAHDRHEYYFIARGSAELILNGDPVPANAGDALFVPAGDEHHFENISEDFAAWAVFF